MARYESVQIQWHDDDTPTWALVSIGEEWNGLDDEGDGRIFYYFASEQEFEDAKDSSKDNGFEFWIVEED